MDLQSTCPICTTLRTCSRLLDLSKFLLIMRHSQDLEEDLFDRNRIYGGIGYKLFEGVNIELGYMNQFLGSLSRDQINVIMLLNL